MYALSNNTIHTRQKTMAKAHTNISLNTELKRKVKQYGINLSEFCEKNLENFLNIKENNPNTKNLSIFRAELAQNEKKLNEFQAKVNQLREQIKFIEEENEENNIQKEKKEAEAFANAKKCLLCGNIVAEGSHFIGFSKGKVHKNCYLEANADQIKKITRGGNE